MGDMPIRQPQPQQQQTVDQAVEQQRSIFNPTDAVQMHRGLDVQNTSVRDYFGQLGIDVDGPVSQLVQFAQKQMDTRKPIDKMKAIAESQPLPEQAPPQGQGQGGSFRDLLQMES
jgi:hypothetical protein